jgi:hypothetical protein
MRRWLVRALLTFAGLLIAAFVATQVLPAERFRSTIETALEGALDRRVEIRGQTRFVLLPRPGFAAEQVVIHEDHAISVEPFAYVNTAELGVAPWALLSGRVEVSALRLVEPSINLMKVNEGGWNVQRFVRSLLAPRRQFPELTVSGGRFNFKMGDVKSVFYLADTDLSVEADSSNPNQFGIQFSGEPARTDRAQRAFGRLSGRGMLSWEGGGGNEPRLQLSLSLERSAIAEFATLLESSSLGIGGFVSTEARLVGPVNDIAIEGRVELDEFERWGWLLPSNSARGLNYRGRLDLRNQSFVVQTAGREALPLALRLRSSDMLSRPRWAAHWIIRDLPLNSLAALMGELAPATRTELPLRGAASGVLGMSPLGLQGMLEVRTAAIGALQTEHAVLVVEGTKFRMPATTVTWANRKGMLTGTFDISSGMADWRLETAAVALAELARLPLAVPAPFPGLEGGIFAGTITGRTRDTRTPEWTFDGKLEQAAVRVDGLAEPLTIASAELLVKRDVVALRAARGEIGGMEWQGSYQGGRTAKLSAQFEEVALEKLLEILEPALRRPGSLLARTLGRVSQPPEWLRARRLNGRLQAGTLSLGESRLEQLRADFDWVGAVISIHHVAGRFRGGAVEGSFAVSLPAAEPSFSGQLKVEKAEWRGGWLDVDATLRGRGTGLELASSLTADGSFSAQGLSPAGDLDLRAASGCFFYRAGKLEVNGVQARVGALSWLGQGATGADGRLALELNDGRQASRTVRLPVPFQ